MYAVELGYPVDVPNIMGSDVFGGARVRVKEVEAAACESNSRVSLFVYTSVDRCSTFLRPKDVTSTVNNLESASCDGTPENDLCKIESQPSGQLPHKAGKMSRSISSSRCSKRPRLAHLEDKMSLAGVNDIKDLSDSSIGPCHDTKCNTLGKLQMLKQKNNYSKRDDRRNFKVPIKAKYDPFTMKAGMASSSSAAGGNNFFDSMDITKHVRELSLKHLLDGTSEPPNLVKDKGKKTASSNTNFLHSVRKAYTSLPPAKPAQLLNFADMDSSTSTNLLICPPNSISLLLSDNAGDKGDSFITEQALLDKESCSKPETPFNHIDFQLYQPKDILERLALPPSKNLEALLLDASKPSASSRNSSDKRLSKQISHGASLPPFPWSHTFTGHCRTNSDAVKLLTSRSACQGRWAIIPPCTTSVRTLSDRFTNLESLTYDQQLVLVSSFVSRPLVDWSSPSLATGPKVSIANLGSGVNLRDQVIDEHCPRVLAAAQTLCSIATRSWRRNPDGLMRWPKKPSQKAMKKSKLLEKPQEVSTIQFPTTTSEDLVVSGINKITSKRP